MIRERAPEDWSDDRLEAAFAARAAQAAATPSNVGEGIATQRGRARLLPWQWLAAAVGSISVVMLLGGSVLLAPRPSQSVPPMAASTGSSNGPSPSVLSDAAVVHAIGDPMTVTQALAIRDGAADTDREILVSGFLSAVPTIYCAVELGPRNPTQPRCPEGHRWLMEREEPFGSDPPVGPAFHPSFALVKTPSVPVSETNEATPVPVVLLGHFHDRRAPLCSDHNRDACEQVFLVDRVISINGADQPVETHRQIDDLPIELSADVDALVTGAAPGTMLAARQLLPLTVVSDVEPALRDDDVLSVFSPATHASWLETVIDLRGGVPYARTFMLLDGTSWFAEITTNSARMLARTVAVPSPSSWTTMPTGDPNAFASAPTSVLGIPVRSLGALQADRQAAKDGLGSDEMAVRAWYVGPAPGATCDDQNPPLPQPAPPCDSTRHWLLDDPQQFGLEPGQLRADPRIGRWEPVLNPVVPVDVPFDPGGSWLADRPSPVPVVVLGHFNDHRVQTYAGNLYFVIDALAWTKDGPATSLDSEIHLTSQASEDASSVLARISAVSPNMAVATWTTVVDAADLGGFDWWFAESSEFATGKPVWIVRRLVPSEIDGRQRLAIEWAWTHDGGSRVWMTESPDSTPDLATTLDLHDLDAHTSLVQVADYDAGITSVSAATGLGSLEWHQPLGNETDHMDVAKGRTSHELVLRWHAEACRTTWRIHVNVTADGKVYLYPSSRDPECTGDRVERRIVITFDRPIDIDKVEGPSCCG